MRKFIYLSMLFFISPQLKAQTAGVGVNTSTPGATLHVKTTNDSDLFIAQLNDSIKLKTFKNGGTSIGSGQVPPPDGLSVKGILQPDNGIVTSKKLLVEASGLGNSITLKAGSTQIIIEQNGNITIKTGGLQAGNISIESTLGNVSIKSIYGDINLSGRNVNINADQAINIKGISTNMEAVTTATIKGNITTIQGSTKTTVQGNGTMDLKARLLRLNDGGVPVAKMGSTSVINGVSGIINGDVSPTVLVP